VGLNYEYLALIGTAYTCHIRPYFVLFIQRKNFNSKKNFNASYDFLEDLKFSFR
jgi:hypothetical protein